MLPALILPVTLKLAKVPVLVMFGCALVVTVPAVVALPAVATDKLATCVVDVTTNGAVPVAIFDINCGVVILALARTCAVPKLPTLALPVTLKLASVPVLVMFGCALVVTVPAVVALPAVATDKFAT